MKKIEESSPENYTVYVKDLRKVFMMGGGRKKVAVSKTSFGIENGECFSLLGVNGAGKTTTYKMLCGEIMPSSGEVNILIFFFKDRDFITFSNILINLGIYKWT